MPPSTSKHCTAAARHRTFCRRPAEGLHIAVPPSCTPQVCPLSVNTEGSAWVLMHSPFVISLPALGAVSLSLFSQTHIVSLQSGCGWITLDQTHHMLSGHRSRRNFRNGWGIYVAIWRKFAFMGPNDRCSWIHVRFYEF
eukprot:361095-Chlamydomonas_euryale.AAC.20